MARGLLGRDHPLQRLHQRRQALREADCVLLAGAPCDFRLDYGRHVRRSAALIAANRSAREARLNRRPDVAAIGDAGEFLIRLAARVEGLAERRADWLAALARARPGARSGDRRARQDGRRIRQPDRAAARDRFRGGRRRDLRRRRRRFRRDGLLRPAPAHAPRLARSRRVRHARRRRRLCARRRARTAGRGSVDPVRRRRLRLEPQPNSTPSSATASRSSPWSATTPAGRRSRASR